MKLFRLHERRKTDRDKGYHEREYNSREREEVERWQQRMHDTLRRLEASVDVITRRRATDEQ